MSDSTEKPEGRKYRDPVSGENRNLKAELDSAVNDTSTRETIREHTRLVNELRETSQERSPAFQDWRDKARRIKEDAIDRLPELIDQVTEAVESKGGHVFLAEDDDEANEYVREVCNRRNASTVVKSKSMTTEEIELNQSLETSDLNVVETDLGEFVAQLADERPSHLIGPIIHKSEDEIAEVFREQLGEGYGESLDPADLTENARNYLRKIFLKADVGITGANFVVAETGTIALVTNEGNARWAIESPDTYFSVAGIEKIIPSISDLHPFFELLPRSGIGRPSTSYFTMVSPGMKSSVNMIKGTSHGDSEFHLVLVDNGRLDMARDPALKEALYCIRCGACLNACGNFQVVGGHVYGGETYTGGIGNPWEAGVTGKAEADSFNDLCTGCSQCKPACPVKIDIPWMNTVIRDRLNRGLARDDIEGFVFDELIPEETGTPPIQRQFFGRFEEGISRLGHFSFLMNFLSQSKWIQTMMSRLVGFSANRTPPRVADEPFTDRLDRSGPVNDRTEAMLLADPYSNYLGPERLEATAEILEQAGVNFQVRESGPTGRAAFSQGMIEKAKTFAQNFVDSFEDVLGMEIPIIVIEPSVAALFKDEYKRLLPKSDYELIRDNVHEVGQFLGRLHDEGRLSIPESDRTVFLHGHCQQRAGNQFNETVGLLESAGCEVITSEVECCGMAGSFGYKEDYYELSMAVGDPLFEQIRNLDDGVVLASGTSCATQIKDGTGNDVIHPVEFLQSLLKRQK